MLELEVRRRRAFLLESTASNLGDIYANPLLSPDFVPSREQEKARDSKRLRIVKYRPYLPMNQWTVWTTSMNHATVRESPSLSTTQPDSLLNQSLKTFF